MPLREELVKQGNRLFSYRSSFPLLSIPLLALVFRDYTPSRPGGLGDISWEVFCLLVSCAGLSLRFLVAGSVPSRTSGRNTGKGQVADKLNETGIYSVVRHPLYLANFLIALGWSLFFGQGWFVITFVLMFWLYYERIMFAEEEYLREKFGSAYIHWATRTPCFLPALRQWVPPHLPFSFRTAVKREYQTLLIMILVFAAFEFATDVVAWGSIRLDPLWLLCLAVSCSLWLIVRVLHKRTDLLRVPGR